MSKPVSDDTHRLNAEETVREESLRVARSIQRPGQTKEQTKQIAQGIAQGIALYKKQQGAKARERDQSRKRALKLKKAGEVTPRTDVPGKQAGIAGNMASGAAAALLTGGTLFAAAALVHLWRFFARWTLILGPWIVPYWVSLVAAVLLAGLSSWVFYRAAAALTAKDCSL